MRQIILADLPIRYPIEQSEPYQQYVLNHSEPPPSDIELGLYSFSKKTELDMKKAGEEARLQVQLVLDRGYRGVERVFSNNEFARGAGIDPKRYADNKKDGSYGIPNSIHLANIEGPQDALLIEMLKGRDGIGRVLNMGCGPIGFQHVNVEKLGINDIVYADNSDIAQNELSMLKRLQFYLKKWGDPAVRRQFLVLDKNDIRAAKREIEPQSISAVIRTGVGKASSSEMDGLKHILGPNGQLFVSNHITGQPIGDFLDLAEQFFKDITAFIGYERYSLACGRPNR